MFSRPLDLDLAQWIWFPSRRTLANTFVLFRREYELAEVIGPEGRERLAPGRHERPRA